MARLATITMEELSNLQIDESGRLYWKGAPVVTRSKVSLSFAVNAAAVLASLSTVVMAAVQTLDYMKVPHQDVLPWFQP